MEKNNNAKVEIFLVVLIALCMLTLIHVSTSKMNEVLSTNNSILLRENPDKVLDGLLGKEIVKYHPDPHTMMEVYDEKFNTIISVPFDNDNDHNKHRSINLVEYDGLRALYTKYPEGHSRIQIGDIEEDVYFRWTEASSDSKKRLAIIYIARPIVKNLWMIPFLCYLILILIFILVVRLRVSCQQDRINYYKKTSARVQNLLK
jgi:hypothetical protein